MKVILFWKQFLPRHAFQAPELHCVTDAASAAVRDDGRETNRQARPARHLHHAPQAVDTTDVSARLAVSYALPSFRRRKKYIVA